MTSSSQPKKAFLQVGFRSPEAKGSLRTIEILGIPGTKLRNGEYVVTDKGL